MSKVNFPITFKAAILEKNNEPLVIDEVEFEGPLKSGQVLIHVHYSGICGKQIEEYIGKMGNDRFLPHLLGHEGFGEVIDKHSSAKTVNVGDKVVMHWMKGEGINSDTPEYKWRNNKLNAGWITTFNEYCVVSENRLTTVDDDTEGDVAALLGCAVSTGVGVVINESNTRPFHSVAVVGCGGVGLNCISGAKILNCHTICGFDIDGRNKDKAINFGADEYFSFEDQVTKQFDKVFVTAPYATAINFAHEVCVDGGDIYVVGVPAPTEIVTLSALKIHKNTTLNGSSGGGIIPERDIPLYYNYYRKNILNIRELTSKVINLSEINESVKDMLAGKANGRHIIKFL